MKEWQWIDNWIDNTRLFKILFFIVLLFGWIAESFVPTYNLFGIYILIQLIGTLAFQRVWMQLFISASCAIVRVLLMDQGNLSVDTFLLNWIAFFCMSAFIVSILRRRQEDKINHLNMIYAIVKAIDSRDSYTAYHSQKVARYGRMIAKQMKLGNKQCDDIYLGGLLHDVGKIGIPEAILKKPSQLTGEEYAKIQEHPLIGYKILEHSQFLKQKGILDVIRHHHERFDGSGYPDRIIGKEIPLGARIIAVADTFDSMTSRRVYRDRIDISTVIEEIRANIGTQFDPEVVEAFLTIMKEFGLADNPDGIVQNYRWFMKSSAMPSKESLKHRWFFSK